MYTFAALMNSSEVTCCCFPVETTGGDDATLGRSQSSHSLLCDAPGLGRHSRYCAAWLFTTTPPPLYPQICVILTFWGETGTSLLSATDLLNRSVCGGNPNQFWLFFSCFNVDASVPPDDGWEAAHSWTRSRHRGVVGPVQSSRHDSQRPVLPRWAVTAPPPPLFLLYSESLTDFVLQTVSLFPPTCLWPGHTALKKTWRVS